MRQRPAEGGHRRRDSGAPRHRNERRRRRRPTPTRPPLRPLLHTPHLQRQAPPQIHSPRLPPPQLRRGPAPLPGHEDHPRGRLRRGPRRRDHGRHGRLRLREINSDRRACKSHGERKPKRRRHAQRRDDRV